MFVYRKNYSFDWPVIVPAGIAPAFEFTAKFLSIPESEMHDLLAADPGNADKNLFQKVFVGWKDGDLVDDSAPPQPLQPDADTIAALADQEFFRRAVVTHYMAAQRGELRAKN